jgi:hypothetical protein
MVENRSASRTLDIADDEPGVVQLIAELTCAGLVSVEVGDDGDVSFALTGEGRQAARSMAMSRGAHARVLLGALSGTSDGPN